MRKIKILSWAATAMRQGAGLLIAHHGLGIKVRGADAGGHKPDTAVSPDTDTPSGAKG